MKNKEIAETFAQVADLLEILGEDRFRVNSYRKVARVIEELPQAVEDIAAEGGLQTIPGVGKSSAAKIEQLLATGKLAMHQDLLAKIPPKLPELLTVGGLGPKTVAKLWKQANVTSIEEFKRAYETDLERLTKVEGIGPKKCEQVMESIEFLAGVGARIRLDEAAAMAARLLAAVRATQGAKRVSVAGSLRRGRETIGDIDLLCEAPKSAAGKIIEAFVAADNVQRVLAKGDTKGSVVLDGDVQADLRVVGTRSYGAALAYFTGSKAHNICLRERAVARKMKLNEYGLFKAGKQLAGKDEEGIYKALGLAYVPPELREDRGEVEAAAEGTVPELLRPDDIRGDLHMHTTASDGVNTIEEMVAACRERGYAYMAIADHSRSEIQAHGLDEKRLAEHVKAIRRAGGKHDDILVLTSIEVDIFKDGSLDFPDEVLAGLDFVTASAHSALKMARPDATRRLITAIEHPHVHCIGHLTGRLINARPGLEVDIDEIAAAAAANHVALEINAHPMRLDLRDTHVRAAIEAGAKIVISTDAHSIGDLDLMNYGVVTARRGWARPLDVVNTYPAAKFKKWLKGA